MLCCVKRPPSLSGSYNKGLVPTHTTSAVGLVGSSPPCRDSGAGIFPSSHSIISAWNPHSCQAAEKAGESGTGSEMLWCGIAPRHSCPQAVSQDSGAPGLVSRKRLCSALSPSFPTLTKVRAGVRPRRTPLLSCLTPNRPPTLPLHAFDTVSLQIRVPCADAL